MLTGGDNDIKVLQASIEIGMDKARADIAAGIGDLKDLTRYIERAQATLDGLRGSFEKVGISSAAAASAINKQQLELLEGMGNELALHQKLVASEKVQLDALMEELAIQTDMGALKRRLYDAEIRDRANLFSGLQLERNYRIAAREEEEASELSYSNLVKQLRAEEIAATKAAEDARVKAVKEAEAIIEEARAVELAETLAAERAKVAAYKNTAYLAAGYSGGRVVGGAASLLGAGPGGGGGGALGTGLLAGVAIAGITYELTKWTNEAEKAAQATQNFAVELGITFEQARNLEEVARVAGVSVSGLAQASGRIAVALEGTTGAGKDTKKALEELGVTGASSGEILLGFLQKLSEVPDATERIAMARRVLGRGAQELVPLIKDLDDIKHLVAELGPSLDADLAAKLAKAREHTELLGVAWDRFKESIATTSYERLQKIVDLMTKAVTPGGGNSAVGGALSLASLSVWDLFGNNTKTKAKSPSEQGFERQLELDYNARLLGMAQQRAAEQVKELDGAKARLSVVKSIINEELTAQRNVVKPLNDSELAQSDTRLTDARREKDKLDKAIKDMEGKTAKADAVLASKRYSVEATKIDTQALNKRIQLESNDPINTGVERKNSDLNDLSEEFGAKRQRIQDESKIEEDAIRAKLRLVKGSKDEEGQITAELNKKLAELNLHTNEQLLANDSKFFEAWEQLAERRQRAQSQIDRHELTEREKMMKEFYDTASRIDEQINADELHANDIKLNAEADHAKAMGNIQRMEAEFNQQQGNITLKQKLEMLQKIDAAEDKAAKDAYDREIADIKTKGRDQFNDKQLSQIAELERRKAAIDAQSQARQLKNQQELDRGDATDRALSSTRAQYLELSNSSDLSGRIIQLTNAKIQTLALETVTEGLGGVYRDLSKDVESTFNGLGNQLAHAVFDAKHFGKDIANAGKSALQQLLGTVIQDGLKLAVAQVLTIVFPGQAAAAAAKAAQAKIDAAMRAKQTVATEANTSEVAYNTPATEDNTIAVQANTVAIYKLIAALSQAALSGGAGKGLGAAGTVAGFLGMFVGTAAGAFVKGPVGGAYAEGGDVNRTQNALVHAGEHVLNADISANLRRAMQSGSFGRRSGGDIIDVQLSSKITDAGAQHVMNRIVKIGRRSGASV